MGVIKLNDIEYGGGGGGVSSYEDLTDKPTINGVEVDGDLTGDDLSLLSKDANGSVELAPSGGSGSAAGTSSLSVGSANVIGTAAAPSQGQFSAAIGTGNTVAGTSAPVQGSAAIGTGNAVQASHSVAAGNGNTVSGAASVALGKDNAVSAASSAAIGESLVVGQASQVAIGKFNENKANTVLEVGGGTGVSGDADERKNLMEVKSNGDLNIAGNFLVNGGILSNMFQRSDIYSTTERMIGQWIDGKPLYQKTFTGLNLYAEWEGGTAFVQSNILTPSIFPGVEFSEIKSVKNMVVSNDSSPSSIYNIGIGSGGVHHGSNDYYYLIFIAKEGNFSIHEVTFQYTKTTDTASSYHVATAYDYSTSETVIGTWIDGSPIYQRTFTFNGDGSTNITLDSSFAASKIIAGELVHTNPANGNSHCIPVYVGYELGELYVNIAESGDTFVSNANYWFTLKYLK